MSSNIAVSFTSIWSIKYETFMSTKILNSPKFQSTKFIPGIEYSFTIEHGNDGYIGIHLNEIDENGTYKFFPENVMVSSAPEFVDNLTIGHEIRSKYFKSYKHYVVITKKYLLESEYTLFHGGFMNLNFNGTFIIDLDDADETENSNSSNLGNFLWNDVDNDFTLIIDGKKIKDKIELQLCRLISKENVCELANKSVEYKFGKLRAFCVNFLSNCITSGKPFDDASNLMDEIALEVFKKCQCQNIYFINSFCLFLCLINVLFFAFWFSL